MHPFKVGERYTRRDVFRIIGIPVPDGGSWFTGYTPHGDDHFIFCGIGTAGRTGHSYDNHFVGDELVWYGNTRSALSQPAIQRLLNPVGEVYIFYREDDRSPFTFAGTGRAKVALDTISVQIVWSFAESAQSHPEMLPNEITEPDEVFEDGAKKLVTVNIYERDPNARRKCIAHWVWRAWSATLTSVELTARLAKEFIHVHHLRAEAEIGEAYELDSVADLRPVCPNCHAMLHRAAPALTR